MARGAPSSRDLSVSACPSRGAPRSVRAHGVALAFPLVVPASILIIADRAEIAALIARALVSVGLRPLIAGDVRHAGLILQREAPEAVVLDLATPGHCDNVMQWVRREPRRAGMSIVRLSARARHAGTSCGEIGTEIHVQKPFTPRQVADRVRVALVRRVARQRIGNSVPIGAFANPAISSVGFAATGS